MAGIAQLSSPSDVKIVDVALTLDTNAYASGDVLADTQEIASAMPANGGVGIVESIIVLDESDQAQGFDLLFIEDSTSIGTENAALNIADAAARKILGLVSIAAGDYADLVNSRIATKTSVGLIVKAPSSSRSIYVAAISRGTGTYAATGIRLRIGLREM